MKNLLNFVPDLIASGKLTVEYLEKYLTQSGINFPDRQEWMTPEVDDDEANKRRKDAYRQWELLEILARDNTANMNNDSNRSVLVGIKAQHPLYADGTPGYEYRQRLNAALEKATCLEHDGYSVHFAVVGAIHDGCTTTSLAESGKNYLLAHGISEEAIIVLSDPLSGYDENEKFAEAFYGGSYDILCISLNVGQMMRAMFDFIIFGIQPEWIVSTCRMKNPHQSITRESWAPYGIGLNGYSEGPAIIWKKAEETRERHRREMNASK